MNLIHSRPVVQVHQSALNINGTMSNNKKLFDSYKLEKDSDGKIVGYSDEHGFHLLTKDEFEWLEALRALLVGLRLGGF